MDFYKRFIGDYHGKTAGLVAVEHGVYNLLLDSHYATELPLPLDEDELCVIARAFDDRSREAVRKILSRYWSETTGGWINPRALEEMTAYREKTEKARMSAEKRWHVERTANAMPTHCEGNASQSQSQSQSQEPKLDPDPEPKSKERERERSRGSQLAPDWQLPEEYRTWAAAEGYAEIDDNADRFRDHWLAQPGKRGTKMDWFAVWRNWMRREKLFYTKRAAEEPPPRPTETDNSQWETYAAVVDHATRLGVDTVGMSMPEIKEAIVAKELNE